jgi:predicted DNA-binding transcriptional regulator YafY
VKIDRLFEIIFHLLNHKSVTAGELAERFGVSKRTIYRDIDTLSLSGIPVYTAKGTGGGVRLMEGFVLNKAFLSDTERREILSALNGLRATKTEEAEETLRKMETIFNQSAPDWFEVDFSGWGHSGGHYFAYVKTAIFESRVLSFDYYNSSGVKTTRRVEPKKLWFRSHAWYLTGFCLTKNEMRQFKLTRMKNLSVTGERFTERNLPVPELSGNPDGKRKDVTLTLRVGPEMAYRVYDEFDESSAVPDGDGGFTVTLNEYEDNWLYGYVLSFGEYAEILEPAYAREIMKQKSEKISSKYS